MEEQLNKIIELMPTCNNTIMNLKEKITKTNESIEQRNKEI